MKKNDTANYTATEHLRDRRSVTIRAIRTDDKGSLIDALNKVSPQSLYFRLFSGKRKFSREEMNQITKLDFVNVVAPFAVLEKDRVESFQAKRPAHCQDHWRRPNRAPAAKFLDGTFGCM